ncbi:hypothetical protein ONZ43_g948 [Nemania bipapillata]|uniref:Uncharacterized protein n=1 Tax=Nemania bipapillata TaxID=110536 RepID=A0ACC2J6C3_9PEZI|nr:hypothetical protein ONZ43_g948 [Nemania bipapillata]
MAPSAEAFEQYLKEATRQLYVEDPNTVTVNSVRQRAEEKNGLEKGFFIMPDWKTRSKTMITEFVQSLLANDSPSSIPEPKTERDTKNGVKRSSSDEPSSSPVAKRQKRATSTKLSKNSKPKNESSSSALSELSDSDVEPKNESKKKTTFKKATGQKEESDSDLSDLDSPEDEPKLEKTAKKPTASRQLKEESESELSDLSSSEDKPKPTKKGGRKSKHPEESDDDEKNTSIKASTSRSKRKQPATTAKRTAKRTKAESDSEIELGAGNKAKGNEGDVDRKIDADASVKGENSKGHAELEEKGIKPLVDDSDSSLSSVLDEPPPRKRKGKDVKGAPKPKQSTAKEVTGDEAEIKKLQGQLVKCGVRKIWGIELKKYGTDSKARIRHLKSMLRDVGMDGRFSEAKAREIKERRELMGELEAVNEMNELWGLEGRNGRPSRNKVVRKSMKEESDSDGGNNKDDKQKLKASDDEEAVKDKTSSRVSKRMADLAFLGSDSESE